jgi:hypothetical protein
MASRLAKPITEFWNLCLHVHATVKCGRRGDCKWLLWEQEEALTEKAQAVSLFEQMLDEVRTMDFEEYQGTKRLAQQDSQLPARLRSSVEVGVRFFRAVQAAWYAQPSAPPPPPSLSLSLCVLRQLLVQPVSGTLHRSV